MSLPMSPLRLARINAKQSLHDVAHAVESDVASISRIERGQQRPKPALAEKLAGHFGLSEIEILYPERYMVPKAA